MFRGMVVVLVVILMASAAPLVAGQKKSTGQLVSELRGLINQADEMVVYGEGFKREFVVYKSSNRKDFEALKSAITLKHKGGPFNCACVDGPEIALLKNHKEIATVWNHEGTAIGSSVWQGEWENSNSDLWLRWFDERGMKFARDFFNLRHASERKSEEDEQRWRNAIPASLKPLWADAVKQYDPPMKFLDLKPLDSALEKQYPDRYDQIRALMAWFGSGAGPWSGFPGYEEIPAKLLREYSTPELIKAVEGRSLSEQELEGVARILGSWTPVADHTPIPEDLRRALLEHCLKSSDEDKLERARARFSGDK